MYDRQTGLLEIAKTVLKPETILDVRSGGYSSRAYSILDRWALNSPDELMRLEAQGKIPFDLKLYSQQQKEAKALMSKQAQEMRKQGLSDLEILQAMEIDLSLKTTA